MSRLAKDLGIPQDREIYILEYIIEAIKDYRGDPAGVIKEIPLNFKGKERYFALFLTGAHFSDLFYKLSQDERSSFTTYIGKALGMSKEDMIQVLNYVNDIILQSEKGTPAATIINGIINSKLGEKSKDYIVFIYGMA